MLTFSAGESKILTRFSYLPSRNLEGKVLTRATDSEKILAAAGDFLFKVE